MEQREGPSQGSVFDYTADLNPVVDSRDTPGCMSTARSKVGIMVHQAPCQVPGKSGGRLALTPLHGSPTPLLRLGPSTVL